MYYFVYMYYNQSEVHEILKVQAFNYLMHTQTHAFMLIQTILHTHAQNMNIVIHMKINFKIYLMDKC